MASPNQRTGKVYIKINGMLYESMSGAKLTDPMGVTRDAVVGADVFGFSEKAAVPTIACEFAHGAGLSLQALAACVNETLTFECDSGPTFIVRNAWYASGMELTGGDGKVACTFAGKKCEELIA